MKSIGELFTIPTQECFKCGNWVRETNRKFLLCNVCDQKSDDVEKHHLSLLRGMPYEDSETSAEFLGLLEEREIDEGILAEYIRAFSWREAFPDTSFSMSPFMWVFYLSVLAQEDPARCASYIDEVLDLRKDAEFREDLAKYETEKYLVEVQSVAWSTLREDIKFLRRLGISSGEQYFFEVQSLVVSVWNKDAPSARLAFNLLSQRMMQANALRKVDEQIRVSTGHRLMEVALGLRKVTDLGLPAAATLSEVEPSRLALFGFSETEVGKDLLAKANDAASFFWMFKDTQKPVSAKLLEAAQDLKDAYNPAARRQNHSLLEPIHDLLVANQGSWPTLLDNFKWSYELIFETDRPFDEALAFLFGSPHRDKLIPIFCNLPAGVKELASIRKREHFENQEFERRMQFGESRWNVGQQDMGAIIDKRPRGYVARSWKNRWSK